MLSCCLPQFVAAVADIYHFERLLALEFRDCLLLGAPVADVRVQLRHRQRHVGRDGVVLEVPIVASELSSWKFFELSCWTCLR